MCIAIGTRTLSAMVVASGGTSRELARINSRKLRASSRTGRNPSRRTTHKVNEVNESQPEQEEMNFLCITSLLHGRTVSTVED